MLTGIGIAMMVVMMGGMLLHGRKMKGGGHKEHARSEASAPRNAVEVSSAPVQGTEGGSGAVHH